MPAARTERGSHTSPRASGSPITAPMIASATLSVASCRTIRCRVAPSAVRSATSRARAAPRASNRFATFAQAMSSTSATAADPMSEQRPHVARDVVAQRNDARAPAAIRGRKVRRPDAPPATAAPTAHAPPTRHDAAGRTHTGSAPDDSSASRPREPSVARGRTPAAVDTEAGIAPASRRRPCNCRPLSESSRPTIARVATEPLPPECVRQHDDRVLAGRRFLRHEHSPQQRPGPERLEEVARYGRRIETRSARRSPSGSVATARSPRHRRTPRAPRSNRRTCRPRPRSCPERRRHPPAVAIPTARPDARGIRKRLGAKQQRIDDAEQRGARRHRDGDRENDDRREPRVGAKRANEIAQIAEQRVHAHLLEVAVGERTLGQANR